MLEKTFLLSELAERVSGEVRGNGALAIDGLSTIQNADPSKLTFLANPAYQKYLHDTKAGAVILAEGMADTFSGNCIVHKNPYLAYALLSELWNPVGSIEPSISQHASIDDSAKIAEGVYIGAGARIAADVVIGAGAFIGENVTIGADVQIGENSRLYAGVSLYHGVTVGSDCTIQSGCVIGSDGFGFAPSGGGWQRISQLGGVIIGDRVEIGANTTIDRGALGDTVIQNGVILDNQIQIAHNVVIGENTAIAACSAVAGSTTIGKNCVVGGASGIAGHLEVVDGVHITAMTMVIKSLTEPGVYSSGTGVQPNKDWKKSIARLRRLDGTESRIKEIEKQIKLLQPKAED